MHIQAGHIYVHQEIHGDRSELSPTSTPSIAYRFSVYIKYAFKAVELRKLQIKMLICRKDPFEFYVYAGV